MAPQQNNQETNRSPQQTGLLHSERGSAAKAWLAGVGLALSGAALVTPVTHAAMADHEGQRVTADAIAEATEPSAADIAIAEEAGRAAAEDYSYPDMIVDNILKNRNRWGLLLDIQIRDPETGKHDLDNTRANIGSLLLYSGLLVMAINKNGVKREYRDRRFRKQNKAAFDAIERRMVLQEERKADTARTQPTDIVITTENYPSLPDMHAIDKAASGMPASRVPYRGERRGAYPSIESDPLKTDEETLRMGTLMQNVLASGATTDTFVSRDGASVSRTFTDTVNGRTYQLQYDSFPGHGTRGTITVINNGQAGQVRECYTVILSQDLGGNVPMLFPPVSTSEVAESINSALERQTQRDAARAAELEADETERLSAMRSLHELTDK